MGPELCFPTSYLYFHACIMAHIQKNERLLTDAAFAVGLINLKEIITVTGVVSNCIVTFVHTVIGRFTFVDVCEDGKDS